MKSLLIICVFANLLASCGPTLYVPNTINTPLLAEKKDFKASIGVVGLAPEPNIDLQGSYAFHDNIAAMGNFSYMSGNNGASEEQTGNPRNSHSIMEGGIGTFASFWNNKRGVPIARAELFTGAGMGWAQDYNGQLKANDNFANSYTGFYQRYFLQPALGIRTRFLDISYGIRLSRVNFSEFKHYKEGALAEDSKFGFSTSEPVMTIAMGYKHVKYYMQFGNVNVSNNTQNYNKVTGYLWSDSHLNIGLVGCPWHETSSEKPGIALETAPISEQHIEQDIDQSQEVLPAVISIKQHQVTICLREGGSPDGDIVSASFNGVFVAEQIELTKRSQCFEVHARPGTENLLQIHAIADGKFKPNTVFVTVKDGKSERAFYLRTAVGKTEEIRFVLN